MSNFLHGVEVIELNRGPVPVQVVKSAVIALIGTAPSGPKNEPVLVLSERDAAQFGSPTTGFTIPQALAAIFAQGAGTVIVVNVFDPATNTVTNTAEAVTPLNGRFKLAATPLSDLVITTSGGSPVTLELGADYTVDAFGNVTILNRLTYPDDTSLLATYKRLDAASVTNAQIIGAIDAVSGARTGLRVYELTYNMFGFVPRIWIAPGFSTVTAIATELGVYANRYRGHSLIDAPVGTTVSVALTGRGPLGAINFNTSSKRAVLCFPHLKAFDLATESEVNRPYSAYLAGVIASTDLAEGYWVSPSNKEIKGIVGSEINISAHISDPQSEANILNENGIVTVFNSFGTGLRSWGNRSAAFPSSTAPSNFIAVQRTADILHESLERACLQFIDRPINQALIDAIRDTVNAFMRTLIQRGAIIEGECTYDPAKNEPTQLAAGQIVFDIEFMPPTPAERIRFDSFINIELLRQLA